MLIVLILNTSNRALAYVHRNDPIILSPEALSLHRSALVVDGHNDLPWALRASGDLQLSKHDLLKAQPSFHTDIPRLLKGGMGAQFWSAFVPVQTMLTGKAYEQTLEQIDLIKRIVAKYPTHFEMAYTASDILRIRKSGKIASLVGVEGGHSIEDSIEKLRNLYKLGTRYMTLTHSKNLSWADSATDTPKLKGLSPFGVSVVEEMNRLGMFVDISHVSVDVMRQVLKISKAPVIASHSSAYAIVNHERNIPDDVLKSVTVNGGVVMVNFYPTYICESQEIRRLECDVRSLVDHIDHIVKVAGIESVGLGSDYDGVDEMPVQLEDVSHFPYITQEMMNRGYTEAQIKKVLGGNLLRAFEGLEHKKGY